MRDHFGGKANFSGELGYPLARMVTLSALRSRLIADVRFGTHKHGETVYARELCDFIPPESLTIVDRGFLGAALLNKLHEEAPSRHWLTRAKSNTTIRVLKPLGKNDQLVELGISVQARKLRPELPDVWIARAITYQRPGHSPQMLLTSLTDPDTYPASEIVELYHERWELELSYDDIKTHLLDRQEALRSRTVEGVRQELWGILLAYNLIRREIEEIAMEAGVKPLQISFTAASRLIIDEWMWAALSRSPGAIPKNLKRLRTNVARLVLPARRKERLFPRAVKVKSGYPGKRSEIARLRAI